MLLPFRPQQSECRMFFAALPALLANEDVTVWSRISSIQLLKNAVESALSLPRLGSHLCSSTAPTKSSFPSGKTGLRAILNLRSTVIDGTVNNQWFWRQTAQRWPLTDLSFQAKIVEKSVELYPTPSNSWFAGVEVNIPLRCVLSINHQ